MSWQAVRRLAAPLVSALATQPNSGPSTSALRAATSGYAAAAPRGWAPTSAAQTAGCEILCSSSAARGFAVSVDVANGNVDQALTTLRRRCADADLFAEIRKRDHHLNPSERKFGRTRASYNRAMGRVIMHQLEWLRRRRRIK
mmetsp:Transcript_36413/g.107488  ORF Transcript_36413/g.107488 Transcript_36413/m.107488 type:complete len:143 (+) Transcript_36413:101-529(+)